MKSKLTTMTIILALIASINYAQNIPQKISFQGRLIDANTQKPVTAEKNFTFKIGDWIEEHKNVQVSNGLYSVILGSINPIPLTLFNDWQANMKILVDGKKMAPDIGMVSVPYAFKAGQLDGVYSKDGNVGIGLDNPEYSLHVKGSSVFQGNIGFVGTNPNINIVTKDGFRFRYNVNFFGKEQDAMVFEKTDSNGAFPDGGVAFVNRGKDGIQKEAMVIRGSGKIGIGIKDPSYNLDLKGHFRFADKEGHANIIGYSHNNTQGYAGGQPHSHGLFKIYTPYETTDGSVRSGALYFNSPEMFHNEHPYFYGFGLKNMRLGIVNDGYRKVEMEIYEDNTGRGKFFFRTGSWRDPSNVAGSESNVRMIIDYNGRVGIGTISPTQRLDVNGDIACNSIYETSDIRYKKNITPIQTPLQKVTQLKGVNYEWKTEEYPEKNFSNGKKIGMIAQDVEKVIPEIVHTDNEGMKSISYDKITAVLVEAIKELKAENEQIKEILCEDRPNHKFCTN